MRSLIVRLNGLLFFVLMAGACGASDPSAQSESSGGQHLGLGWEHSCSVNASGAVRCTGSNAHGALGDGSTTDRSVLAPVSGLSSGVTGVFSGGNRSCALLESGAVKCWGWNSSYGLGDGSNQDRLTPVDVLGLSSGVKALAMGYDNSCALTLSGAVKCWGANVSGSVGNGTLLDPISPVDVVSLSAVTGISIGEHHVCARSLGGEVWCWGINSSGQLGNETLTESHVPAQVQGLGGGARSVVAGYYHSCALTDAGGVKCWGSNYSGCLGDGSTTRRTFPVDVIGLSSGVSALVAGYSHTCALLETGKVKCWGGNGNGQLGTDNNTSSSQPVDVVGLSDVVSLYSGAHHVCAQLSSGSLKCWGENRSGQLGDGTTGDRKVPAESVFF
jgi:alpha-tubulin suppressor-like RCC1 family protein